MRYLDIDDLLLLYTKVINHSGGSLGVRDVGRLEAAIASQHQEVFGSQVYKTVFDKCAALCRGIIADHPFVDGNKRTAILTTLTFLLLNNITLNTTDKALEDFAVKIANEKLDVNEIADWFKKNSSPVI